MRVAVLFSGGKDSTYATYIAKQQQHDEVACLITMKPSREDSYMFHHQAIPWTSLQARAMDLPQIIVETEGVKEDELRDLKNAVVVAKERYSIEGVYTGALASEYQKSRVDRIALESGVASISPLWHIDPETHLRRLIETGFDVVLVGVAALGLSEPWLGRRLDEKMVVELARLHRKYGVNIGLEGGEGETFVLDCPIFNQRIELISTERVWRGDSGHLIIRRAALAPK